MISACLLLLSFLGFAHSAPYKPNNTDFTPEQISAIKNNLAIGATHSWEIGTRATALLEYDYPHLFLYRWGTIPPKLCGAGDGSEVIDIVNQVVAQKPANVSTFWDDAAAGDPASIGIPALIANWTNPEQEAEAGTDSTSELDFLLCTDGRTPQGAMSQRRPPQPVQLWSDFISMAPPFISYYGALHCNESLLLEGYTQIQLYREALLDDSGLLEHIILGQDSQDYLHWSTGNGWAVNGMIRVLRIIQLSPFAYSNMQQQSDLINWAATLLKNIWQYQQPDGSILNYIDLDPNSGLVYVFPESSGTALLAACTYRLATFAPWAISVEEADRARQYIVGKIGSDGWLEGVVNPLNWRAPGEHSPEGQAFTLMLAAAYRDWKERISPSHHPRHH